MQFDIHVVNNKHTVGFTFSVMVSNYWSYTPLRSVVEERARVEEDDDDLEYFSFGDSKCNR